MPKGHYCFRCKKNFLNEEGTLCEDSNGRPQILCGGCYIMESIRVIQKKLDALVESKGFVNLNDRLGLIIMKLELNIAIKFAEVVNA